MLEAILLTFVLVWSAAVLANATAGFVQFVLALLATVIVLMLARNRKCA